MGWEMAVANEQNERLLFAIISMQYGYENVNFSGVPG
jgi:hypothetical protein